MFNAPITSEAPLTEKKTSLLEEVVHRGQGRWQMTFLEMAEAVSC